MTGMRLPGARGLCILATAATLVSGCASAPTIGDYFDHRLHDLCDIVGLQVGLNRALYAEVGIERVVHVPVGWQEKGAWYGLIQGKFGEMPSYETIGVPLPQLMFCLWPTAHGGDGAGLLEALLMGVTTKIGTHPDHRSWDILFIPIRTPSDASPLRYLDVSAEISCIGPGLRVAFSPGELLDSVFGVVGIDLAGDDTNRRWTDRPIPASGMPQGVPVTDKDTVIQLKTAPAPSIDGVLDDAAWARAAALGDCVMGHTGRPPVDTKVLVTYDEDSLYVAVINSEPDTDKLKATVRDRDGNIWEDDSIELYVDPSNAKKREYYAFLVNSANVAYDRTTDSNWNGDWKSGTRVLAGNAWVAELAIPWKIMGVTPNPGHKFGLNVVRNRFSGTKHQDIHLILCVPWDTAKYTVFELQ